MTLAQEETVTMIFNLLKSLWEKTIFHKARRFSMSLPRKRPRSNNLETKNGPNPQKVKKVKIHLQVMIMLRMRLKRKTQKRNTILSKTEK